MSSATDAVLQQAETILAQCLVAANEAAAAAAVVMGAAPLDSPHFTGLPTAPTANPGTNTTQLATTGFITNQKGAANGIPSLDSTGHIPTAQLPASVLGGLAYQGVWNASTNTPTIVSGVGTVGYFYVVDVAGSTSIDGNSTWDVGDWIVYGPSTWHRVPIVYSPVVGIALSDLAVQAADTFVANATGSSAAPTAISAATATALLSVFGGDSGAGGTKGLVPAPASGDDAAGKFLKASGGWATVPSADLSAYALLSSPAFSGTPTAPTRAADTNSTAIATTAFVIGQASDANPIIDGAAAPGTTTRWSRADHVHPTDTSRAPLNSPALTGTPTAPTQSAGNNSTRLATTAYVDAATNFPSGTIMLFQQTAAPTGWTKITTYNDVGLRVVSGSVGAVTSATAFSTVFAQTATGSHALDVTEMPSHNHTYSLASVVSLSGLTSGTDVNVAANDANTSSVGGGLGHTHAVALNLNYVDVIFASKN